MLIVGHLNRSLHIWLDIDGSCPSTIFNRMEPGCIVLMMRQWRMDVRVVVPGQYVKPIDLNGLST